MMAVQTTYYEADRLIGIALGEILFVASLDGLGVTLGAASDSVDLDMRELADLAEILSLPEVRRLLRLFSRPGDDTQPDPAGGGPIADWLRAQFGLSKLL